MQLGDYVGVRLERNGFELLKKCRNGYIYLIYNKKNYVSLERIVMEVIELSNKSNFLRGLIESLNV